MPAPKRLLQTRELLQQDPPTHRPQVQIERVDRRRETNDPHIRVDDNLPDLPPVDSAKREIQKNARQRQGNNPVDERRAPARNPGRRDVLS